MNPSLFVLVNSEHFCCQNIKQWNIHKQILLLAHQVIILHSNEIFFGHKYYHSFFYSILNVFNQLSNH